MASLFEPIKDERIILYHINQSREMFVVDGKFCKLNTKPPNVDERNYVVDVTLHVRNGETARHKKPVRVTLMRSIYTVIPYSKTNLRAVKNLFRLNSKFVTSCSCLQSSKYTKRKSK
jgi:hypothetical protein